MAFRPSKERRRKVAPVAQGRQLVASAGIEEWYRTSLDKLIRDMTKDYRTALDATYDKRAVKEFYATEDASPTAILKRTLRRLRVKWVDIFASFSERHSKMFAEKNDKFSQFSSKHSLKALGLANPKDVKTEAIVQTLQASIQENVALIKNIQQDFANDIEGTVFRSIASNDPNDGIGRVFDKLVEREDITKRRAHTIARDQNSKLYANLNKARMEQNGIKTFRWKHSSAGKTQRESHIQRETQDVGYGPGIFRFDSPELWEGREADRGIPGEAINCRCRAVPILTLD
jgi:uncharacterized protein with gpF-like domain